MVELWKPMLVNKTYEDDDKYNDLLFNDFGEKYFWYESLKILVFLDDDKNNKYYYLELRDTDQFVFEDEYNGKYTLEDNIDISFNIDEKIKYKNNNKLIDGFVDTSRIFVIDKDKIENFIDFEYQKTNKIEKIDNENQNLILKKIGKNIMEYQPNFSILKVDIDGEKTFCKSSYMCDEKIERIWNDIKYCGLNLGEELEEYIPTFDSAKENKSTWTQRRHYQCMNFCIKFLEKYYAKEINKFASKESESLESMKNNIEKYQWNYKDNKKVIERER